MKLFIFIFLASAEFAAAQVTIGAVVNGATSAILCAAPVSAGQITIPSYVLLNLQPTGTSIVPGTLNVQNGSVGTFPASGLDLATIRYSAGYSLSLKFQ